VSYQIDAQTYDGRIEWDATIMWRISDAEIREYPISPTSGSMRIPIGGKTSQPIQLDVRPNYYGDDSYWTSDWEYVYISDDPSQNGCEPAPTTTTTEPAPTTTTTEPAG
jgi:hypothetical protein